MVNNLSKDRKTLISDAVEASKPIISELSREGIQIASLSELLNTSIDYRNAIPVLLRWLPKAKNPSVKETIIRALTVKWAKPIATQPLIDEFRKLPETEEMGLKWAIGNALAVTANDDSFDDIVNLVRDKKHGRSREMLAVALGNMKNPRSTEILIELLDDEQITGHVLIALRKKAPAEAKDKIEEFLEHPKPLIRNEAKTVIAKIDIGE